MADATLTLIPVSPGIFPASRLVKAGRKVQPAPAGRELDATSRAGVEY